MGLKCCDFDQFLWGLMESARRNNVPVKTFDWLQMRRRWRSGMTGHEALVTHRDEMLMDGEYIMMGNRRRKSS